MVVLSWGSGLPDHWSTIASACIQAFGTIAAALIAALLAKRIVKGFQYRSYSDAPNDIRSILGKARSDIFIITAVGNKLLKTVEDVLEQRLRAGIHVRFMLLALDQFHVSENYLHGSSAKSEDIFFYSLETLSRLQRKYPDGLEIRLFPRHMSASYIGIDTSPAPSRDPALFSPFVQVMLYQYRVRAQNSVILSFYEKTDQHYYDLAVDSMRNMWEDACARLKNGRG